MFIRHEIYSPVTPEEELGVTWLEGGGGNLLEPYGS
jgi:hypothetical protein